MNGMTSLSVDLRTANSSPARLKLTNDTRMDFMKHLHHLSGISISEGPRTRRFGKGKVNEIVFKTLNDLIGERLELLDDKSLPNLVKLLRAAQMTVDDQLAKRR